LTKLRPQEEICGSKILSLVCEPFKKWGLPSPFKSVQNKPPPWKILNIWPKVCHREIDMTSKLVRKKKLTLEDANLWQTCFYIQYSELGIFSSSYYTAEDLS
jgi:hypothetical protein